MKKLCPVKNATAEPFWEGILWLCLEGILLAEKQNLENLFVLHLNLKAMNQMFLNE